MLLAVDIGNSNIKIAVFAGETQAALWRCATQTKRTVDEYAVFISSCAREAGFELQYIAGAILCSVVPGVTPLVSQAIEQLIGIAPKLVTLDVVPIKCLVDNPGATGTDRLAAIMGVRGQYTLPALIVDFGTCTTFTVIDADGNYRGGAIAPGVDLALQAMYGAAAQLPKVELAPPPHILATNTAHAMQSGIYHGTIAMVEGMIARLQGEFAPFATIVASSGICPIFKDRINGVTVYDPHLNLTGLRYIHESFCA
jgi:type III pantothenate kinase